MAHMHKILLVEDNPDDIELTIRAFQKSNITNEIIVKCDGEKVLDYFFGPDGVANDKHNNLPILILLDLKLPKISGLEVLQRIKTHETTKRIPVVIMTSSNEQQDVLNGYNFGCNSYIRKPVDFTQFAEAIKHLGLYWLVLNEPPVNHI